MHETCLICSSKHLEKLERYAKTHMVSCQTCGFHFSQKIPSEKEIVDFYDGYGRDDYLSPLTIKRYHELLDEFEKYRKHNKILDVGCGIGYFLEVAQERGWEVYGTEYTDKAVEICEKKGIQVEQGKLNPEDFDIESFDIITSFEVLEHINNPIEEINNFYSLLRKGGLVYLTTPNFNSLLRYRLKEAYNVITYPEHLSYYTPKTINKLFKSIGFRKEKIRTTGISLSRLKASKGIKTAPSISANSTDENIRQKLEKNNGLQHLKTLVNWGLTLFGVGDSLKAWFIKI